MTEVLKLSYGFWMARNLRSVAAAGYYRLFRAHLRLRCWCADRFWHAPADVPPAMLRYRISELLSIEEFLRIGEGCALHIRQRALEMGVDLDSSARVLDFGCGCGRTIRWFLNDASAEFHGVDVDADAIAWCQKYLPRGRFLANGRKPPLPYPDQYFDAAYCVSVFTHLDESMQDAWLAELHRILKPGGAILLSVHGEAASAVLAEEDRAELQRRGFLHRRSQKLRGMMPEWYQTTWHSREYIVKRLAERFEDVRYFPVEDGSQDIVAGRRHGA